MKKKAKEVSCVKSVRIYEAEGLEAAITHLLNAGRGGGFRTSVCESTATESEKERCLR